MKYWAVSTDEATRHTRKSRVNTSFPALNSSSIMYREIHLPNLPGFGSGSTGSLPAFRMQKLGTKDKEPITPFIDIGDVDQIVHISQTRGISHAIHYAVRYMDGKRTLKEIVGRVIADINDNSLDILTPHVTGDIARFRAIELAAAINRMRTLMVAQKR